jgi:hypothetical protein
MRYWPKSSGHGEFIGIAVALGDSKFSDFQRFMERHIGRADLWARLSCQFHGFSEPHHQMPDLPTKEDFINGRHYFVVGDHALAFGVKNP